jgi:hypothetical protein
MTLQPEPAPEAITPSASSKPSTPLNPYLRALGAIAIVASVIGVGLVLFGVGLNASPSYFSDSTPGAGQILWGAVIAGFGFLSGLLWMVGHGIRWVPPVDTE